MSITGYEIFREGQKQGNIQGHAKRRELDKLRCRGYKIKKNKIKKKWNLQKKKK